MRRVLLVVLLAALTGCTGSDEPEDSGPDPEAAAAAFATGLETGDLSDVTFAGGTAADAQAAYDALVAGLGEIGADVEVTDVKETEDAATATLHWSWAVTDEPWEYDATADLALVGDEWQVTWAPTTVEPSLEPGETLQRSSVTPDRGDIVGARGLAIVTERAVVRIGMDKPSLDDPANAAGSARALAQLVGVDGKDFVQRVKAAGDKAFVEAIVFRREEVPTAVTRGLPTIDGARAIAATLPLGPTRDFAAPILGRVGEVTAEMVEEDPERYHVGDVAGISGLQARYDDQLRGTPGVSIDAVAENGTSRGLVRYEAEAGASLGLTLDVDLQTEAENLLADVASGSALVAIRPSTGEILAAANGPGNGGLNLATFGQFAPGSTFKTVSSLALLRIGETPSTRVPCTPSIVVDGKRFTNHDGYPSFALGNIPLRTAIAYSCNTAYISQAPRLGPEGLFDAGVSLGIGLDHDIGFPAYFGSTDPADSKTGAAAQMIGQGTILASPMVMATVMASVQNGSLVIPWLVDGVQSTPPDGAQPLTTSEGNNLQTLLRGVVTDGAGQFLLDVPGPPVRAKTGTAEFGTGDDVQTHAWMIGAQGDLAVCVFVDIGESGSGTAGPILEAFLRAAR
jgi:hypothetical protein